VTNKIIIPFGKARIDFAQTPLFWGKQKALRISSKGFSTLPT
jgi:hypothetical protein